MERRESRFSSCVRVVGAAAVLLASIAVMAQQGVVTPGRAARAAAVVAPNLKTTFTLTKCGLTYVQVSAKLAQRNNNSTFPAVAQPVPFTIAGIPANATIEKAYLWWVVENQTGGTSSVVFKNPISQVNTVQGTLIGTDAGGKCWSGGTASFRADVTNFIPPPYVGPYSVTGLPVSSTAGPDTDGVTLFIAYSVPGTGRTGTVIVNDGLIDSIGANVSQQIGGFVAACTDPTARTFVQLADFQKLNSTISVNGGPALTFNEEFWDWEQQTAPVTAGQTSSTTQIATNGDCYAWQVLGISYSCPETECKPCQPVTVNARKQYAAKFVCHRAAEKPLQVVNGYYGTTLNVHNPAICQEPQTANDLDDVTRQPIGDPPNAECAPVRFAKKVAIALPGQKPGKISNFRLASLKPDQAFQIDCADILSIAGVSAGSFLDGFVVIDSEGPLDITAVYTARPVNGEVSTLDVEDVRERDVNAKVTFCPKP